MTGETDLSYMTTAEFLQHLDTAWAKLQSFIASLTPEQMTGPADAAGWTVKDHLLHLSKWQDMINAVLEHERQSDRIGVDEAIWQTRDFDAINAVIYERNRDLTLEEVLESLRRTHDAVRAHVAGLSDAELQRPFSDFSATSTNPRPIIGWLEGDSFGHYEEHLPWMKAIVGQS